MNFEFPWITLRICNQAFEIASFPFAVALGFKSSLNVTPQTAGPAIIATPPYDTGNSRRCPLPQGARSSHLNIFPLLENPLIWRNVSLDTFADLEDSINGFGELPENQARRLA